MKLSKEIFDKINTSYGASFSWITDLAAELGYSYSRTRKLCVAAGYYRHRRERSSITLAQFEQNDYVAWMINEGLIRSSV